MTEILTRLISPLTNMLLARLLTPAAFGVVATVTLVVSFTDLFTDAGFQKYLIQHEFSDEDDLYNSTNVAFWTNLTISIILWLVLVLFSEQIAAAVGNPGRGNAIATASISVVLSSFTSIQTALYRRRFNFKTLFSIRLVTALIPLVVTVPLAFLFHNYWALIIGVLVRDLINAVLLTLKSPWKPQWRYSLKKLKEMISFSFWSMMEQITIWLTNNIGIFIVSRFLSEYYIGLYKISMSTVNSYMQIITAATTPVLFSALSRFQTDEKRFLNIFYKFQRFVSMLVMPMAAGLYLYKEFVTDILLGHQWHEAAGFIGTWSITSAITIIFAHYNSEIYRSKGKPKLSLLVQLIHLCFLVIVLPLVAPYGFKALYTVRSVARIQLVITSLLVMWFFFKISTLSIIRNILPPLVSTIFMSGAALVLKTMGNGFIWNVISIVLCIIIYFITLLLFPNIRKDLLKISLVDKLLCRLGIEIKRDKV